MADSLSVPTALSLNGLLVQTVVLPDLVNFVKKLRLGLRARVVSLLYGRDDRRLLYNKGCDAILVVTGFILLPGREKRIIIPCSFGHFAARLVFESDIIVVFVFLLYAATAVVHGDLPWQKTSF